MSVNRLMVLFIALTVMIPIGRQLDAPIITQKMSYDFWLNPLSFKSFPLSCAKGTIVSGDYVILIDGDYYEGDQQKYDLWPAVQGIILMIFQDAEYQKWIHGDNFTTVLTKSGYPQLSWSATVFEDGQYQIVYSNDAITRKRIQGQITISNDLSQAFDYLFIPSSVIIVISIFLIIIVFLRKRKVSSFDRKRKRAAA